GDLLVDEYRSRLRTNKSLQIFTIFQKAHIVWAGRFERTHIMKESCSIRGVQQPRPTQRRELFERKRSSSIEEARIRHLHSTEPVPLLLLRLGVGGRRAGLGGGGRGCGSGARRHRRDEVN